MHDYFKYKKLFLAISEQMGVALSELQGVNSFLHFFERVKLDRAVIIVSMGRKSTDELYSLSITGGLLKKDDNGYVGSLRLDTSDLEGGLAYICVRYAEEIWE